MKTVDAQQDVAVKKKSIAAVYLAKLDFFSDRDAGTVEATLYAADHHCVYDYENTGTDREFEPLLAGLSSEVEAIQHLPSERDVGLTLKTLQVTLLNRKRDNVSNLLLIDYLEARTAIAFSSIEVAELILPAGSTLEELEDLTDFAGDEHTVRFRGDLISVNEVTEERIVLTYRTRAPEISWLIADQPSTNDPRDLGRRLPVVFGSMPRVPGIGWEVGWVTSMAEELDDVQTTAEVTNASGLGTTGTARIAKEEITWTGKTGNQLTGVVRGVGGTVAVDHTLGTAIVEVIDGATWIFNGVEADAINDVYIRNPFNREIVRLDSGTVAFTKTPADTTTISGATIASISFTSAQLKTLLEALAAAAAVSQQPAVTHDVGNDASQQVNSGPASNSSWDNNINTWHVVSSDINEPPPGADFTAANYDFSDIGVVTSMTSRVKIRSSPQAATVGYGAGGEGLRVRHGVSERGIILKNTNGTFTHSSSGIDTNRVVLEAIDRVGEWAYWPVWQVERDVSFDESQPVLVTQVAIIGGEVGFGLEFYADIDGVPAPDANYDDSASGVMLDTMPDILRYILVELCGFAHGDIDWADASGLSTNEHACIINTLGADFVEIATRLAFESRANLVMSERAAGTTFRLLTADDSFDFPASVRTLDTFSHILMTFRDAEQIFTRFRGLREWDPSKGATEEAFSGLVRIDPDQSDHGEPTAANMGTAETKWGRREAPVVVFQTIQHEVTSEEVLGYYATERIRDPVHLYTISGIPWDDGYDLEFGDIVTLTPPWASSGVKMRIVGYSKEPQTEQVTISTVEVT